MGITENFSFLLFNGHFSSGKRRSLKATEAVLSLFAAQIVFASSRYPCRALNLTVSTVSRPLNNREKRISAKILMNVVSDFGFFFYGMRYCHEKTGRKDGRLGTPHRKPAENLLFLRY